MAEKIIKNDNNNGLLEENGNFQANSPQNTDFSDTPSPKSSNSELETPQSPILKGNKAENQQIHKDSSIVEGNQGFFDQLTTFLADFLEKQGISNQRVQISDVSYEGSQNLNNSGNNPPQSVSLEQKEEKISEIESKAHKPSDFSDYQDFLGKYPNIGMQNLENDQSFLLFLEGREKTDSIEGIYKNYESLKQLIEREAVNSFVIKQAQEKSSVGSLSSPNSADTGFFTREQVMSMSKEQISRNYDKIRKSQQSW